MSVMVRDGVESDWRYRAIVSLINKSIDYSSIHEYEACNRFVEDAVELPTGPFDPFALCK